MSTREEDNFSVPKLRNSYTKTDKPEMSSDSTAFTVAASVSSFSSSTTSAVPTVASASKNACPKSFPSLNDTTISRLIDAASLGDEQDTCGSISALLDQFEHSLDQNGLTPSRTSDFRANLRSSFENKTSTHDKKFLISPHEIAQKKNNMNAAMHSPSYGSHLDLQDLALTSSPETAELEEVYTILDEDVLLPPSVHNQTDTIQAEITVSSALSSFKSPPGKSVQALGKEQSIDCNDVHRKRVKSVEIEERVYEEVFDPPAPFTKRNHLSSSSKSNCFQIIHTSAEEAFTEVELNVDEDPLEIFITSPSNQYKGLTSSTKRHAIYQNHEPTLSHSQQKQASSFAQSQFPPNLSYPTSAQCNSPVNNLFNHMSNHEQQAFQSPLCNTFLLSEPSKLSVLRQNSYPVPWSNTETITKNINLSVSCTKEKSNSCSQIQYKSHQNRLGYDPTNKKQVGGFYNGFPSAESLPDQSAEPGNRCRDRAVYSPSSESEAIYNLKDYDCNMPVSKGNIHTYSQSPATKPPISDHVSNNTWCKQQPETQILTNTKVGPLRSSFHSTTKDFTTPTPCKSKSLGDLTSEDISCNFQSKYHIISRSFIKPQVRKQKHVGAAGDPAFHSQPSDPLTEQLRRLVSLEGDNSDGERPLSPQLCQEAQSQFLPRNDSPPVLARRLSSRSQSRVRHINSRARERQQEAMKSQPEGVNGGTASISGVVLRNKATSQNLSTNRHSTGSYIAGYLDELDDRGLPEGTCTFLRYSSGDHYGDLYRTDDSLPSLHSSHSVSEPEVYFLLRL